MDCRERMSQAGLEQVYWHGKCEAEKVATGTYQVEGRGGMFALVSFVGVCVEMGDGWVLMRTGVR